MKTTDLTMIQRQTAFDHVLKDLKKIDDIYTVPFDGLWIYWPFIFDSYTAFGTDRVVDQILDDGLLFRTEKDVHPDLKDFAGLYETSTEDILNKISSRYLHDIRTYCNHSDLLDASMIVNLRDVDEELAIVAMIEGATLYFDNVSFSNGVPMGTPTHMFRRELPNDDDMLRYMEEWGGFDSKKPLSMVAASFYEKHYKRFTHKPLGFMGKFSDEFYNKHKHIRDTTNIAHGAITLEQVVNHDGDINNYDVGPVIYYQHKDLTTEHLIKFIDEYTSSSRPVEGLAPLHVRLDISLVNEQLIERYPNVAQEIAACSDKPLSHTLLCKLLHIPTKAHHTGLKAHPELDHKMITKYSHKLDIPHMFHNPDFPTSTLEELKVDVFEYAVGSLLDSRAFSESTLQRWFSQIKTNKALSLAVEILTTQAITVVFRKTLLREGLETLIDNRRPIMDASQSPEYNTLHRTIVIPLDTEEYQLVQVYMTVDRPSIHIREHRGISQSTRGINGPGYTCESLCSHLINKYQHIDQERISKIVTREVTDMAEYANYISGL